VWSPQVTPAPRSPGGRPFFHAGSRPEDVIVAVAGLEVAGYVSLRPPTALPANAHVLHVTGLAVAPAHQRRGIARTLLEAAMAEARRRGARRLTLRVLAPNAAARALYEGVGFVVEGVQRGEFLLAGAYVDDVLMAHDLA
jgi:ribosomal protein S18 acetylase RimI-like enzyme